ncbi:MAG: NCS2 family permease [Lautropia sp.]|nr:NCS2 family permease [Lautropia sp.]
MAPLLERTFQLQKHGTSVRTEIIAGCTTFLTMAYILFVNPSILGDVGMPREAVFVATCLVSALGSTVMALYANYPIAIAPGMGLHAFFAFTVVGSMGYTWQAALGAVFLSGCLFMLTTLLGLRSMIVEGIPATIRLGTTAGIGMFLALIGLGNAGVVVDSPATLVTLGDMQSLPVILAGFGFFVIVALDRMKVPGAVMLGIMLVTALSFLAGDNSFQGAISMPQSIAPTFLQLDIKGAWAGGLLNVILVLFLIEMFDATGTMMGVAKRAGLYVGDGNPEQSRRLRRALMADSTAIMAGSVLGTSSATAYVESAAGVQAGGRTGLVALTVAVLFMAALFFSPLAAMVPKYATAPALLFVACLMLRDFSEVDWQESTEAVPAVITALAMPFTYSIANGLALGFISYAVLKLLTGKWREVHPLTWGVAVLFLVRFIWLGVAH